jgi:hypothetical protein
VTLEPNGIIRRKPGPEIKLAGYGLGNERTNSLLTVYSRYLTVH